MGIKSKIATILITSVIVIGSIIGTITLFKDTYATFKQGQGAGGTYAIRTKTISMTEDKIEKAIKLKGFENKFIKMEFRSGLFSSAGAGAGGLGTPQMFVYSAEQLLSLVPKTEPIYMTIERMDLRTLRKVYFTYLENRPGVIIYEDENFYHVEDNNWIISYDSNTITLGESYFQSTPPDKLHYIFIIFCAIVLILMAIILGMIGIISVLKGKHFWEGID